MKPRRRKYLELSEAEKAAQRQRDAEMAKAIEEMGARIAKRDADRSNRISQRVLARENARYQRERAIVRAARKHASWRAPTGYPANGDDLNAAVLALEKAEAAEIEVISDQAHDRRGRQSRRLQAHSTANHATPSDAKPALVVMLQEQIKSAERKVGELKNHLIEAENLPAGPEATP